MPAGVAHRLERAATAVRVSPASSVTITTTRSRRPAERSTSRSSGDRRAGGHVDAELGAVRKPLALGEGDLEQRRLQPACGVQAACATSRRGLRLVLAQREQDLVARRAAAPEIGDRREARADRVGPPLDAIEQPGRIWIETTRRCGGWSLKTDHSTRHSRRSCGPARGSGS